MFVGFGRVFMRRFAVLDCGGSMLLAFSMIALIVFVGSLVVVMGRSSMMSGCHHMVFGRRMLSHILFSSIISQPNRSAGPILNQTLRAMVPTSSRLTN
jgi:hypothetical protein